MKNHIPYINRREFLKITGAATAATTATLTGCSTSGKDASGDLGAVPVDKMTYTNLPALGGDRISILGYGCMRWPTIPNPAGQGTIINQEVVNELVDYAIAHGVNYFDTAPAYVQGQSERATGIALKRHARDKFFIATKMSNPANPDFDASVAMYRNSFEQLQVDYIDYYLCHNIGTVGARGFDFRFLDNGLLDFLLKERESGRIRHLGWSFHGVIDEFDRILAWHEKVHWDFVQIQLNYSDWRNAATGRNVNSSYLHEELTKRNIPIVVMEPLLGGRLSNLPTHIVSRLKEQNPEGSAASWAFRYAGSLDGVATILSGMTYMEHLQDNIRTYSPLVPLTEAQKEFLYETAELMLQYPTIPCNGCDYCMPCPYGIDIPGLLVHYNKCVNEGMVPKSGDANYRKNRRAFLISFDRNVERIRQADHCIGCKQCIDDCPQRINVPAELHKLDAFIEQLKQDTL